MRRLVGAVAGGKGDFGRWIARLQDHYARKTGLRLYPGTLNVHLAEEYRLPAGCLRLEGVEYGGRVNVNLVRCSIFGRPAFILRTDLNEKGAGDHPRNVVEVASDLNLRQTYRLKDGSLVEIEVE